MNTRELWTTTELGERTAKEIEQHYYGIAAVRVAWCTQVYNRLEHLKRTFKFPNWLWCPFDKFIVFDWGSDDGTREFMRAQTDPRIVYLRRVSTGPYNMAQARNTAMRAAFLISGKSHVIYTDADIELQKSGGFDVFNVTPTSYGWNKEWNQNSPAGCYFISFKQFCETGGFNERFEGWGYHLTDFTQRLVDKGYRATMLPGMLRHIDHDDALRCKYYAVKDRSVSVARNKARASKKPWTDMDDQETFRVYMHKTGEIDTVKAIF